MFRLSDSKVNLEFPSGQPLVSSPDLAPVAVLPGGLRPCSAPTRMDMPGDGDEVNYDQKRVDVFHVTSLSNVIIVVEFKIYSS